MANVIVPGYFTELSAVNYVLGAIGEQPLTTLTNATQADVTMILNLLTIATAEVLAMWQFKFNTEIGYQLQPAAQIQWTDPAIGQTESLNVFVIPPTMAQFRVNPSYAQSGINFVDVSFRRAIVYNVSSVYPLVFYDRDLNREGFLASAYPFLALDVAWFWQFVDLPFSAQLYICAKSARQAAERIVNAGEIAGYVKTDEAWAYRALMRGDGGLKDSVNALRTVNAFRALGNRPTTNVGFIDIRGQAPAAGQEILKQLPITTAVVPTTVTQAHGATTYTATFTLQNPNSMAVAYAFAVTADNTVVLQTSVGQNYTNGVIAGMGTLTILVTYLVQTSGSGSVLGTTTSTGPGDASAIGTSSATSTITGT